VAPRGRALGALCGLAWCFGAAVTPQAVTPQAVTPQEPAALVISGEVRVADEPADTGTVVLHRVSASFTGEVDSVAVGSGGGFEFVIPGLPEATGEDVYFASIRYQGVLYFGGPVTEAADTVGTYLIRAYPAVGATPGIHLPLRVRNTFAERAESGTGWRITDLFEIENNTQTTIIASEHGPSWSYPLPPGAVDFAVGESDLASEAASYSGGRVNTSAPVPPGESVYLFRYRIAADAFTLPLEGATGSMELLFREPAGEFTVGGLAAVGPTELEGGIFRRFAGRELAPSVVTVEPGRTAVPLDSVRLVAVLLALALTVAGSFLAMRARLRPARVADSRRQTLVEIARLDEAWHRGELEVDDYDRRRERLLGELEG